MLRVLSLLTFLPSVQSNTYEVYRTLQSDLLRNYSKDIRPVNIQTDKLQVNISLKSKAINKFDEIDGVLHMIIALKLKWRDELIKWNPSNYDQVRMLRLPMSKVWTPPFFLINSAAGFQMDFGDPEKQTVIYFADGSAQLTPGILTSSECSPSITYYPFDSHNCSLHLATFFLEQEISLQINQFLSNYVFEHHPTWELVSVYGHNFSKGYMSFVIIYMKIKRRPTFLLINIFAPILFLAFANLFVFAIPIESGERISFAVTILLSLVVFLTLVTDKMPQTSLTVSFFSVYLLLMITYSFLIILALVFVLGIYHKEDENKIGMLNRLLCILEKKNSITAQPTTASGLGNENREPRNEQQRCSNSTGTNRMKRLASALDRICLMFFSVFLILISVINISILAFT
ncbi:neuronal acetylcholine receptor subunit alpha-6-like [Saccostrea cucullata]|uniref:neuronal acetylcholine receptor subunit alpha-6-like n=1 Tax=Saccostrea cuccullata TaxID=36930 RepID=UPI002ED11F71